MFYVEITTNIFKNFNSGSCHNVQPVVSAVRRSVSEEQRHASDDVQALRGQVDRSSLSTLPNGAGPCKLIIITIWDTFLFYFTLWDILRGIRMVVKYSMNIAISLYKAD